MRGTVESIYRHPVKGLTPEHMMQVQLTAAEYFPGDRAYAIEVGPSGFDPQNPKHISKQRFTVLARFPSLARLRTGLDDATGAFHLGDASGFGIEANLSTEEGRGSIERFLQAFLGEEDAFLNGVGTASGTDDLTHLTLSDGFDTRNAYLSLYGDYDTGIFTADVPLSYYSPDDEYGCDLLLSAVIDSTTSEITSSTYYVYNEKTGNYGEFSPKPDWIIVPSVLNVAADGAETWYRFPSYGSGAA